MTEHLIVLPDRDDADRLADERDGWVRQWRQLMGR